MITTEFSDYIPHWTAPSQKVTIKKYRKPSKWRPFLSSDIPTASGLTTLIYSLVAHGFTAWIGEMLFRLSNMSIRKARIPTHDIRPLLILSAPLPSIKNLTTDRLPSIILRKKSSTKPTAKIFSSKKHISISHRTTWIRWLEISPALHRF